MEDKEVKELLKHLISIKSVSGEEEELKKKIKQEVEGEIYEVSGNLIVKLDNDGDHALHFNAHMDTVSGENWCQDPLEPVEKEGKIYGLGASDLKGGIAALIALIDDLEEKDLEVDIFIEFVTDEEVDGSGTQEVLKFMEEKGMLSDYKNQSCVLTEPTGLEKVEIGCKGCVFAEITAYGESVHGSRPEKGENPVLKMKQVINRMKELKEDFKQFGNEELGSPTIAVGTTINASGSVNSVPSSCMMTCDIRTTPDIHSKVMDKIEKTLPENVEICPKSEPTPPSYTKPGEDIINSVKNVFDADIDTAEGADDSPFYEEKEITTAVIGPGEKDCIHSPGEFIEVDKLLKSVELYAELAEKWSKTQSEL